MNTLFVEYDVKIESMEKNKHGYYDLWHIDKMTPFGLEALLALINEYCEDIRITLDVRRVKKASEATESEDDESEDDEW